MQEWQNEDTEANARNMNLWLCVFWKYTDDRHKPTSCTQKKKNNFSVSCTHLRQILQHNCMHHKHKRLELNNSNYINIKMAFQQRAGNVL